MTFFETENGLFLRDVEAEHKEYVEALGFSYKNALYRDPDDSEEDWKNRAACTKIVLEAMKLRYQKKDAEKFKNMSEWFSESQFESIYQDLNPEQNSSAGWIMERLKKGYHGALCADDMGIGKTLTSLVCAALFLKSGYAKKIIIFAPKTVASWWKKEYEDKIHDSNKIIIFGTGQKVTNQELIEAKIIITNYEYIRKYDNLFRLMPHCSDSVVIMDEITAVNNYTSKNHQASLFVSYASNFVIGLSGTPATKNVSQAWSIIRVLDPNLYPKKEFFQNHYAEKTIYLWDKYSGKGKKRIIPDWKNPELFKEKTADFLIRHEKDKSQISAVKVETDVKIPSNEAAVEISLADHIKIMVNEFYNANMYAMMDSGEKPPKWTLRAMSFMSAALDDPYTIFESDAYNSWFETPPEDDAKLIFDYINSLDREYFRKYAPAKVRYIKKHFNDGKKTIIFSSSIRTAKRLAAFLPGSYLITGETKAKDKTKLIENFRKDPQGFFLIATDTLAFGVNLQFADRVIHYSLPWSLDVLQQRSDRIYRVNSVGVKEIYKMQVDYELDRRKDTILKRDKINQKKALGF